MRKREISMREYGLQTKLILLGTVISVLSLGMGASNFYGLKRVSSSFRHVSSTNLPSTEFLGLMAAEYREIRIHLRTLGMDGVTPQMAAAEIEKVKASIVQYEKVSAEYAKIEWAPGEEALYNKLNESWASFKAVGGRALDLYQRGGAENMRQLKEIFFKECPESAAIYNENMDRLIAFQHDQSKQWVASADQDAVFANQMNVVLILVQSLGAFGMAFMTGRRLSKVLGAISEKLTGEANEVALASERISKASVDLSSASQEQATALQETSAAITEVNSMVSKNAENAARSTEKTRESVQQIDKGKASVQLMIQSIENIDVANAQIMAQVEHSNVQMAEFVNVIHEIGEKTKVINDIVFQTKLLSFNASVEAARAGEHGKGFAVVAEEVGNLAQMSGNAAREISTMLQKSSEHVESIASETRAKVEALTREAKQKIQQGLDVSRECGQSFEEIVSSVELVSQMVNEIAAGSHEQSQGVSEIVKAIHQMDEVTQKNNVSSENVSNDAHQLNQEAEKMRQLVNELTTAVQGSKGPSGAQVLHLRKQSEDEYPLARSA